MSVPSRIIIRQNFWDYQGLQYQTWIHVYKPKFLNAGLPYHSEWYFSRVELDKVLMLKTCRRLFALSTWMLRFSLVKWWKLHPSQSYCHTVNGRNLSNQLKLSHLKKKPAGYFSWNTCCWIGIRISCFMKGSSSSPIYPKQPGALFFIAQLRCMKP